VIELSDDSNLLVRKYRQQTTDRKHRGFGNVRRAIA
jgi:hypothetical protein